MYRSDEYYVPNEIDINGRPTPARKCNWDLVTSNCSVFGAAKIFSERV